MEQQIQDLINSIKKDGIESATNESKRIIEEAEKKAEKIIADANAEKDKIIADGMKKIEKERESYHESLKMAARDLSLSFRTQVETKLNALLSEKVRAVLDEAMLKDLVKTVVEAAFKGDVVVTLPMEKKNVVSQSLLEELASSLNRGVELSFSSSLDGGFRVVAKDGRAFIDLSDEEITKLLYPYISSSVRELI